MVNTQLHLVPIGDNQSLKVKAYEALKAAIMDLNIYDPSTELRLDERELSAKFGVSRTPLREALAQLDQEGLVRIIARRGIYIVRKSKQEILDMITVWAALESMAARVATQQATDAQLSALDGHMTAFTVDVVASQMGEYSDANIRFHQAIINSANCPLIGALTDKLFFHVRAIRQRTIVEQDRARRSVIDHNEIVAALVARDTDRAERLVRDHTLKLRDHVERYVAID
jgi:DNA-binding GntR family transcriptional regulator